MTSYRRRYGADTVQAFRQGDQSLPGKIFPLLANRYAIIMDGQWRYRDIAAAQALERAAGKPVTRYGVWPLPKPAGATASADGWVNGNFFLVPRGASNPQGAWAFMKFWSGFAGHESEAAETCRQGGWIPASQQVIKQPCFPTVPVRGTAVCPLRGTGRQRPGADTTGSRGRHVPAHGQPGSRKRNVTGISTVVKSLASTG